MTEGIWWAQFFDGGDPVQAEEHDDARVSMSLDVDWGQCTAQI